MTINSENRDFKGIWIPAEVYLDTRLSALEKIVLVEIDSLCSEEQGCFASNSYLADFCQCSETKVSNAITKLTELGYVRVESFNGRSRILQRSLTNSARQPYRNCEADLQNLRDINIDYKHKGLTKNNILPIAPLDGGFEEAWDAYPKKQGKKPAEAAYLRSRKKGATQEEILKGIEAYKAYLITKKVEYEYIKQGSTFFRQEAWADDWSTEIPGQVSFESMMEGL